MAFVLAVGSNACTGLVDEISLANSAPDGGASVLNTIEKLMQTVCNYLIRARVGQVREKAANEPLGIVPFLYPGHGADASEAALYAADSVPY
jgi:hypothetical protein